MPSKLQDQVCNTQLKIRKLNKSLYINTAKTPVTAYASFL